MNVCYKTYTEYIIKVREKMRNCLLFNLTVHVLLTGRIECVKERDREIQLLMIMYKIQNRLKLPQADIR
jgi:hypothetical protein